MANEPFAKWKNYLLRPDYLEKSEMFFLVISSGSEKSRPLRNEISPVGRNDWVCRR
jgi:hypothetical protein